MPIRSKNVKSKKASTKKHVNNTKSKNAVKNNVNIKKLAKKFVPEEEPEMVCYDPQLIEAVFPKGKNIKMEDLQITNIGKYSVSCPEVAAYVTGIVQKYFKKKSITVTDANANVGGNTISFAMNFGKVNAVEIIPMHCKIIENNLKVYGLNKKVTIHCNDYFDVMDKLKQDVIYFDPPWGGASYKNVKCLNLYLNSVRMDKVINYLKGKAKLIVMRVPYNFDLNLFLKTVKYDKIDIYRFIENNYVRYFVLALQQ